MSVPVFDRARFEEARARIAGSVHRTPLLRSRTLSALAGAPVYLKCENLQMTGSFKVRGALHRLLRLGEDERRRGVVTISAGNAAQAVAWAARTAGVPALVVMPEGASRAKVEASRGYGAEVVLHGDAREAFAKAHALAEERGLRFVHPFDDEEMVAGHGSCALEIMEDLPDVGTIVVPVGGGGLVSAIAAASAAVRPAVAVWGVEPEGADAMRRSLEAGVAVHLDSMHTLADGLAAPMAGVLNYALVSAYARGVVTVSDEEIVGAMRLLLERTKLLAEPAGAAGLAAVLAGRIPRAGEAPVAVVLSGGNVDLGTLGRLLSGGAG
ncbi:MAG TPA: threonine/serine dehydratase [Longimicrobiales bacterium]|nr:threonine/serine dehydratase [Longimicrobiales bacterium]